MSGFRYLYEIEAVYENAHPQHATGDKK